MDMRQILEAFNKTATTNSTPVSDTNDMKKFMSIISEGSNPHKVALPVQMAMQHYAPVEQVMEKPAKVSLFKKYMAEASDELEQDKFKRSAEFKQYAQYIANKVMNESANQIADTPIMPTAPMENPQDVVTMDIPLLIRLLEYAREDAQTDMDLHDVTERLIQLSTSGDTLTMHQYNQIVGAPDIEEP